MVNTDGCFPNKDMYVTAFAKNWLKNGPEYQVAKDDPLKLTDWEKFKEVLFVSVWSEFKKTNKGW